MTITRIGILDLEMGNLRSVYNAINTLGYDVEIVTNGAQFEQLSHLIIPGVGSYFKAAKLLDEKNLRAAVNNFSESNRPILGICLGMHLLSEYGEEGGRSRGLGLVPGCVAKLNASPDFSIPHVGWNSVNFIANHPVFKRVKNDVDYYFVHSYHFNCKDQANINGTTEYGEIINSIVGRKNVIGFQFHPEKSQANGLQLIENFCNWDGTC